MLACYQEYSLVMVILNSCHVWMMIIQSKKNSKKLQNLIYSDTAAKNNKRLYWKYGINGLFHNAMLWILWTTRIILVQHYTINVNNSELLLKKNLSHLH